jgi:hypothetical protein
VWQTLHLKVSLVILHWLQPHCAIATPIIPVDFSTSFKE